MSAHTTGRLTHRGHGVLIGGPMIELTNGSAQGQVAMVCVMDDVDHIENARRLAACWNACEGFDTEDIEGARVTVMEKVQRPGAPDPEHGGNLAAYQVNVMRADSRAIEANYEAARALLEQIDQMDDACGIATSPGEAFTTYEFQALMGKVSAFLKGGA